MEKTIEIENLGLLKLKTSKLFVGLLPTDYKALIVNYNAPYFSYTPSRISVSCIMPPESHKLLIKYGLTEYGYGNEDDDYGNEDDDYNYVPKNKKGKDFSTLKHRTPTTLLQLNYADMPNNIHVNPGFIFIYKEKTKNKIHLAPYLLPNVGEDGSICFGNVGRPKDLRSLHSLFWNSPFNNSMTEDYDVDVKSNVEYVKRYKNLVLKHQEFVDMTDEICGEKFWSTSQSAEGLLITNSQELLQLIPRKYWLKDSQDLPFLIVLADSTEEDKWVFRGKSFKFELEAKSVVTSQSTNKKLITATKKATKKEVVVENSGLPTKKEVAVENSGLPTKKGVIKNVENSRSSSNQPITTVK